MKSKMVLLWGLVPLVSGILMVGSPGQASDPETAKILKEIESIRKLLEDSSGKNNERALSTIRAALASPKATYEFFMAARKQLDFDEEGKRESDWREWRDSNEGKLKEADHIKARQLQLQYLALSITAAGGAADDETLKTVMPDLISYLDTMATSAAEIEDHRRVLERSVLNSTFGKQLKLDLTVDSELPWVYSPLNVADVYEKTVMPYYRRARDMRGLASAWDRRILHEGKIAALPELEDDDKKRDRWRRGESDRDRERDERREEERTSQRGEEVFRTKRMPELKWGKARDGLLYGADRIAALSAMTRIVKDNLDHKSAREWLSELAEYASTTDYELEPTGDEAEEEEDEESGFQVK